MASIMKEPGMNQPLPACPVETTLLLIGNKWRVLILRDLLDGTRRFGELKKSVGDITQKMLTANLRFLEDNGVLVRKVYATVPPKVEYTLTSTGYSLRPVMEALASWGEAYKITREREDGGMVETHGCRAE